MDSAVAPPVARKGQSLIIVAFAIITLVALVGLAVDLGLLFVERIRIRRAADAAALAAAAELPLESAAHVRALEYLQENGYPCGLSTSYAGGVFGFGCSDSATRVEINAGYPGQVLVGPEAGSARRVIQIDTVPLRDDANAENSANRIQVAVQSSVPMYFMRLIGFGSIPVYGHAIGENINNLDVVIAFDKSGSMEFDTLCYGCWTEASDENYPEGNFWPLPWNDDGTGTPAHCSGSPTAYYSTGGYRYSIIEAEEYSRNSVPHDRNLYVQGMTYWAMNRNGGSSRPQFGGGNSYLINGSGAGALGRDSTGAYMSHLPFASHSGGAEGQGSSCTLSDLSNGGVCLRDSWISSVGGPYPNPRLDYDFRVPSSGTWYVWARGSGGDGADHLIWGLDRSPQGSVSGFGTRGYTYNGTSSSYWRWVRLGTLSSLNANTTYELNIWGGAAGFDFDRLLVTNYSGTPSSSIQGSTSTSLLNSARTDQACDPCDVRFGGSPDTNGGAHPPHCEIPGFPADHAQNWRFRDDLFDDEQPIRAAVEASKRFVQRLDPRYDQIGLVTYSSSATVDSKLECVRRLGSENCTLDVIENTVISDLNDTHADGGTNIPEAIYDSITVLSNTSGQYGRPSAAHIMILMTDGEANVYTINGSTVSACYAQDFWPHNTGDSSRDRAKDCVIYYTRQARNNGIVIYTITLGASADIELMQQVAELTGGIHRHAPRAEQLDPIFDELYERIFLRLVE